MKKNVIYSGLILLLCFLVLYKVSLPRLEYETGKDTHEYFGNGQYQLLTSSKSINNKQYSLFNMKYHISIIDKVIEYQKTNDTVYFYGEHQSNTVYALLYLNDNRIIYCQPKGDIDILYANDMINAQELEIISEISEFEKYKKTEVK